MTWASGHKTEEYRERENLLETKGKTTVLTNLSGRRKVRNKMERFFEGRDFT